jgi:hypothetical protein
MNDAPLQRQIEAQLAGVRNHVADLRYPHRGVESNVRRAEGHLREAVRLSLKLRRMYARAAARRLDTNARNAQHIGVV